MRILHFSDVHATINGRDHQVIQQAFLKDVSRFHEGSRFDLVIFSGDLAYSGQTSEFAAGRKLLLEPLMEQLRIGTERIVIVPGNHDLNLGRIDEFGEAGLAMKLTNLDAVNSLLDDQFLLERHLDRLRDFLEFHRELYKESAPALPLMGKMGWVHKLQVGQRTIGIAALNSAWRATGAGNDGDKGKLLIGDRQVKAAIEALNGLPFKIAVFHHPLDWLSDFDHDSARRDLEKEFQLVLTGHTHHPDPISVASPRGSAVYCQAGCLYQSRDYFNSYSIIDVDFSRMRVEIIIRSYWPDREEFDKATNIASEGRVEFEIRDAGLGLPDRDIAILPTEVDYTAVTRSLAEAVYRNNVVADTVADIAAIGKLSDLLVEPVLLSLPYAQAVAASKPQEKWTSYKANPVRGLDRARCVLIAGQADSGLTSTLIWILDARFQMDSGRLPVYTDFRTFGQGKDPLKAAVRTSLASMGFGVGPKDSLPPMIVAIDNITMDRPVRVRRVAKYIRDHDEDLFVIGCLESEHQTIHDVLATHDIEAQRSFVGPFGRRQLRALSPKLPVVPDSSAVDAVLHIVGTENLPRSPFLMSALLVLVATEEVPLANLNESSVVDRYASLLLSRVDPTADRTYLLDFRNLEHVLTCLSEKMLREDTHRLSRLETESFLLDYFRSRGWQHSSAGKVIDSFIGRRVLLDTDEGIEFRHSAFLHLFGAKRLLEDSAFKEFVLSKIDVFRSVIRHATALDRSDANVLEMVAMYESKCLDQLISRYEIEDLSRIADVSEWNNFEDLEELARQVRLDLPEDHEAVLEQELDELDDVKATQRRRSGAPELQDIVGGFGGAVSLLSSVLRNSELVADVELKNRLTMQALQGWTIVGGLFGLQEEIFGEARKLMGEVLSAESAVDSDEDIDRIIHLFIVISVILSALSTIGSPKLSEAVAFCLDDEGFMSKSGNALLASVIYAQLQGREWPRRLQVAFEKHGKLALVRELIRVVALHQYHFSEMPDAYRRNLEMLLADIALMNQPDYRRRGAPVARAEARSYLIQELQNSRMRLQMRAQGGTDSGFLDLDMENETE